LLAAVLHGFDDETCLLALRNLACASGRSGARIALLEMVLPEVGADIAGTLLDMQMFVASRGRERALTEWRSLFERSGVTLEEVIGLQPFGNILVLRPKNSV
jgi:hypothetical protein